MSQLADTLRRPAGIVWMVLVAATCVSLWLGTDHGFHDPTAAMGALLAVAFVKVALIGGQFMELNHASRRLRQGFYVWAAIAWAGLTALLLLL